MIGRKGHELLAYWGMSTATGLVRYQCSAFGHADCRRGPLRCEGTNGRPLLGRPRCGVEEEERGREVVK